MATSAVQEGVLEEMMDKVSALWQKTEFEVRQTAAYVNVPLLNLVLYEKRDVVKIASPGAATCACAAHLCCF